jgi:hypothetical protein
MATVKVMGRNPRLTLPQGAGDNVHQLIPFN